MTGRYTWILDPGHGGIGPGGEYLTAGKQSPQVPPGIYEGQFNRRIAERVIAQCPCAVMSTTTKDPANMGLAERAEYVRGLQAIRKNCMLISIHANALGNGKNWNEAHGATVFHHPSNAAGQKLARRILYSIGDRTELDIGRGIRTARFAILSRTRSIPGVLVECGFMTQKNEAIYLASDEGQAAIAFAIAEVIQNYEQGFLDA